MTETCANDICIKSVFKYPPLRRKGCERRINIYIWSNYLRYVVLLARPHSSLYEKKILHDNFKEEDPPYHHLEEVR